MIRKLRKTDIDEVAYIWLAENKKSHGFISAAYWEKHFETVKKMFLQTEMYVYEENDSIKGFIGLDGEYIAGIFVRHQNQSTGIGRKLLNFLKNLRGQLELNVYQKNEGAVRFYKREQFEIRYKSIDTSTGEVEYLMVWKQS